MLDPASFQEYMYPRSSTVPAISDSGLSYDPPTAPIPGYPSNPRMLLVRLYLQLGIFLDYYLGEHDPSISAELRDALTNGDDVHRMRDLIPERHIHLFPQFGVDSDWPPTYLVHGELDSAVPVHDSDNMYARFRDAGVPVKLEVVKGQEHSFGFQPDAEHLFASTFDAVLEFLNVHLGQ
jgi:acetyl esterase/lipase